MTEMEVTTLLLELGNLGVTGIKVYYEGSGDSGSIENIVYTTEKLDSDEETNLDTVQDLDTWGADVMDLSNLDSGLRNRLENHLYEKILDDIEDWWNNDGGYGSLAMLIPSGKYNILNNIRYTQVETYAHEGGLIEKSAD